MNDVINERERQFETKILTRNLATFPFIAMVVTVLIATCGYAIGAFAALGFIGFSLKSTQVRELLEAKIWYRCQMLVSLIGAIVWGVITAKGDDVQLSFLLGLPFAAAWWAIFVPAHMSYAEAYVEAKYVDPQKQ
jgi:Na+/proline symporter